MPIPRCGTEPRLSTTESRRLRADLAGELLGWALSGSCLRAKVSVSLGRLGAGFGDWCIGVGTWDFGCN